MAEERSESTTHVYTVIMSDHQLQVKLGSTLRPGSVVSSLVGGAGKGLGCGLRCKLGG